MSKCKDCRQYNEFKSSLGECRLHPPILRPNRSGNDLADWIHPIVLADSFCEQFVSNEIAGHSVEEEVKVSKLKKGRK